MSVATKQAPKGKAAKKASKPSESAATKASRAEKKAAKVAKADKERRANEPKQVSKRVAERIERVQSHDRNDSTTWLQLGASSSAAQLDQMTFSKAFKSFKCGTSLEMVNKLDKEITFPRMAEYVKNSNKYKDLSFFTINDMKLIASKVLKQHHAPTARKEKVKRQNKAQAKK